MQRTVAQNFGVREETVGLWENNLARPLLRHYGRIVQFLGYDPEAAGSTVAGRLRTIRRRLGLSQAEFASLAGLDEGSVCRWESGSREPGRWMAKRVARILDPLEDRSKGPTDLTRPATDFPALTYFDRTRWRRRPPTDLTDGKPRNLGDRIRQRRLELGLSQEQLGKRFGVKRGAVRQWERGKCEPHESRRDDLLQFLYSGLGTEPTR